MFLQINIELHICTSDLFWNTSLRGESVILSLYVGKKLNECKTVLEADANTN
jgi:hypothetical protein